MRTRATVELAVGALLRHRMRSALTVLGVVIGVGAVLMMQSLGEGASAYIQQAISGMGSNVLLVIPGAPRGGMGSYGGAALFTPADLEALRRTVHDATAIAPVANKPLRTVAGGNNRNTPFSGVTAEYFSVRGWALAKGRGITVDDVRQGATVCVLGQTVVNELFPGEEPLGREVRVHDLPCRVVGVLESKGASAFGMDQDDVAMMPLTTFQRRVSGSDRVSMIIVSAEPDALDAAKDQLTNVLRRRRHVLPGEEDDFAVRDPRELQAVLGQVTSVLSAFLLGVAAISLLVGGIGIMNIMLVSVTERTREIGVRLAVGARERDVLRQFLVEAIALSVAGGILGVGLGLIGARVVSGLMNVPFVVPISGVPIALGVSLLVGVIFGVVPARKASRLSPLAALRFE